MIPDIKKITAVFILLTVSVFLQQIAVSAEAVSGKNSQVKPVRAEGKSLVLLINSYHKGLSWTDDITSAIEEKLTADKRFELYIEYLDAKRHPVVDSENQFYNLMKIRYSKVKLKVVIVSDNNALAFAKRYREELFPDTPVIFCGINNFTDSLIDSSGWFTGVVEKTDAAATFSVMKKINPKMRSCIIIGDNTPTGAAEISAAQQKLGTEKDGVKIIYWINLSTRVLLKRLSELDRKDDMVLLTVFNRDLNGHYYSYEESGYLITSNTTAQVYGLWDFYIGKGIVGGFMANAHDQGQAAAEMALRILNGEDHSRIMIQRESPNRLIFDYALLNKFKIKMTQLPPGSIIRNIPHSFISENLGLIAATLLLIISEGGALLLLFRIYLKSRKRAVKDLEDSEKKYRMLVDNSFDIIYRVNSDGVITFASPSWSVVLGHDLTDVVGKKYTDFVHSDDAEKCREFLRKVISSSERHAGVDYRVRHIDGSWRTHNSSAVPILDESGKFLAFVGIATDITERKNSENEIKKLLQEKELLLKEVHHRIKNNMSTISGLLYLQADSVKNDVAASALNDARSRVQSMMVIYDKLYRSADFRSISAKDYLSSLITGVSLTFVGTSHVTVDMEIEDYQLDSAVLFPVGIIINELMSNVYKYAFPGQREGIMQISFIKKSDKIIEIFFRDNGVGISDEVLSGKSAGFGMNLVKILVEQLSGNIQIAHENGTEYRISFPS